MFCKYHLSGITAVFFTILLVSGIFDAFDVKSQNSNAISIDSVSVTPQKRIIIGWTYYTDVTNGYVEIHRRLDNGLYARINSVLMPQTFYIDTDPLVDPGTKSYSYYVVAYDTLGNVLGQSANDAHETIFFKGISNDVCEAALTGTWQNYAMSTTVNNPILLPTPFTVNQLFYSFDGDAFLPLEQISGSLEQTTLHVQNTGEYCLFIRATDPETGFTSSSNVKCTRISFPVKPEFAYIRAVSVNEPEGQTDILLFTDNRAANTTHILQRSDPSTGQFVSIDTVVNSATDVLFSDRAALYNQRSETYRVLVLDSCGIQEISSLSVSSIFLEGSAGEGATSLLQWNSYEGWTQGVESYTVERSDDPTDGFSTIAVLPGFVTTYEDDLSISGETLPSGTFYYRVRALENPGNPFGFRDQVVSNSVVVQRELEILIPNAFRPTSSILQNRIFKPVFPLIAPDTYSLTIFNQWGQQIFSTSDRDIGWDGTIDGVDARQGVYAYVIQYSTPETSPKERRGAVLLVR